MSIYIHMLENNMDKLRLLLMGCNTKWGDSKAEKRKTQNYISSTVKTLVSQSKGDHSSQDQLLEQLLLLRKYRISEFVSLSHVPHYFLQKRNSFYSIEFAWQGFGSGSGLCDKIPEAAPHVQWSQGSHFQDRSITDQS